jgi:cytochrome c
MKWVVSLIVLAMAATPVLAAGDADAGATVFKKCMACHAVGEGAKNKVGPQLNDVFGRTAGTAPDYKYSKAMIEAGAGGLVWTEETLKPYLRKPKDVVPGTKMAFAGLPKEEDEDNLIAYLLTFSPNYVPPAPAP